MTKNVIFKIKQNISPAELFIRPKLQYVCLKINDLCNARCSFCDIWQRNTPPHPDINWLEIIDDLISLEVEEINIHGGEAFLSKCFFPMLQHGNGRVNFSLITNGSLIDKFYDRLFANEIKKIYISIDHVDPLKNAESRGIKRLEHVLYPTIERIKSDHPFIELIINHVVTNLNVDTIKQFLVTMKSIGINAVNLIPIKDAPDLYLTLEQIRQFYIDIDELLETEQICHADFLNGYYKIFGTPEFWPSATQGIYNSNSKKACIIPAAVMFVNGPTGNVYPCDTTMYRPNSEQYIMGNVITSRITDIWSGLAFRDFRNKMYPKITCQCINGCDPANTIN